MGDELVAMPPVAKMPHFTVNCFGCSVMVEIDLQFRVMY